MTWQVVKIGKKAQWILLANNGQWLTDKEYTLDQIARFTRNCRNLNRHMATTMRYW